MINIINIIIFIFIFILLVRCNNEKRIAILLLITFFPLSFSYFGKDSITVSTLLTCMFSINYIYRRYKNKLFLAKFTNVIAILLVVIASISTIIFTPVEFNGPAVRKLVYFISSVLLFLYITNLSFQNEQSKLDFIEKILSVLIISVGIQVVITFLILKFPQSLKVFNYFTSQHSQGLVLEEGRARSLVFSPESYGEILAVFCPVLLYKIHFKKPHLIYFFLFILFGYGLLLANTRSGIILFIIGYIAFIFVSPNKVDPKLWIILVCVLIISSFYYIYNPNSLEITIDRFVQSYHLYNKGEELSSIVNRSEIWNLEYVLNNLSIIGNGLLPAFHYGDVSYHLHNLYMTVLFQFGIIGFLLYFSLIISLLRNLIFKLIETRKYTLGVLCSSLIISFFIFFVNEIKFEFNRYEAYQQIIWSLFGVYFLLGSMKLSFESNEQ